MKRHTSHNIEWLRAEDRWFKENPDYEEELELVQVVRDGALLDEEPRIASPQEPQERQY